MRYFVTGGAGFIGSNYVDLLLQNVSDVKGVTVYDNFTYAANVRNLQNYAEDKRLRIIRGDINDYQNLTDAISGHDFVVHFAAESHVDRSIIDSNDFILTNLLGTKNVLEAAKVNKINRVLHVSTDEVYGSLITGKAFEDSLLCPNSPYSASKAGGDLIARSYHATFGLDVVVTRSCNNYGRYQFPEKVIPVFIRELIAGRQAPIYGNGLNEREWIHVEDHCRAIQLALLDGESGEVYNIGTGVSKTNLELAKEIADRLGILGDYLKYVPDRQGHDLRYSVDFSKIMKLGFTPLVNFNVGLDATTEWYANNLKWWPTV
jgi:dTDP-glucose 4,6-dehydratase